MDQGSAPENPDGIAESNQQKALMLWATANIDELANQNGAREHLCELVDWVAHFTREHFGFQQRLLNECGRNQEYLLRRMAVHGAFRRQLAQLCIDGVHGDTTVPERFRTICHEIVNDVQAQEEVFTKILCAEAPGLKLRGKPRRGQLATKAEKLFESPVQSSLGDPAT